MDKFRKLRIAPIRKFRRRSSTRVRRSQRWLATLGCTAACGVGYANATAAAPLPAPAPLTTSLLPSQASPRTDVIETPAHINRLAWAWLREFQRDLQDDCDNRLEANNR
ncbi:hypothetical protein AACH06_19185 [Ideonella sp. DXS29W]|uniref:Uncharacterized protein n=1 Tax=Ideonella lacteola TaxID=2984193 RepID=A0ABU9BSK0_9BURK